MQAADHARPAAGDFVELLRRLEADALLSDDLLEVERFAEGAAEVLPHARRDPLALGVRKLGIGERKIAERAFLPMKTGGDEPPSKPEVHDTASSGNAVAAA